MNSPQSQSLPKLGGKGNLVTKLERLKISVPKSIFFDLNEVHSEMKKIIDQYEHLLSDISKWSPNPGNSNSSHEEPHPLRQIREKIISSNLPVAWENIFVNAQTTLGVSLIVRSSMSTEDLTSSSMAGCFESSICLEVDSSRLWNAARRVLASAFTPESMLRILELGFSPRDFRPGFFIQHYIRPTLAGVCFSRDPSQIWKSGGLLEWGTSSEAVVQGNQETYTVRQNDQAPEVLRPFWAEIWRTCTLLESEFKAPIDLEWVWDGRKLWIVQVRPQATEEAQLLGKTLHRFRRSSHRSNGVLWTREVTQERFPEPLTPMGYTALEDVFSTNLKVLSEDFGIQVKNPSDAGASLGGYIYADPGLFKFPGGIKLKWSHFFAPWKMTFWRVLKVLSAFALRWLSGFGGKHSMISPLLKLELSEALLGRQADRQIKNWDSHRDQSLSLIASFQAQIADLKGQAPCEILVQMEDLRSHSLAFMRPDLSIYLLKEVAHRALKNYWVSHGFSETQFPDLVNHFEGNRTLQMNQEWENFAAAIRHDLSSNETQTSLFVEELLEARSPQDADRASMHLKPESRLLWQQFITRNGHVRTTWDLAMPSWQEAPAQLGYLLKCYLSSPQQPAAPATATPVNRRTLSREQLLQAMHTADHGHRIALIQKVLARLEALMRIDEEHHFLSGLLIVPSRTLIDRAAEILVQRGQIFSKDDVFFLKLQELKSQLTDPSMNLTMLVQKRRAEWERNRKNPAPLTLPPPSTLQLNPVSMASIQSGAILQGQAVSQGIASGPVHFLEHFTDLKGIPAGAILVTTSPNPSFAPAFPALSGLITLTGGPLSHGFVTAREYSLPAVSGVSDAFSRLTPGATVQIDGTRGLVFL